MNFPHQFFACKISALEVRIQLVKIAEIPSISMNLKYIALQLCTCTWIEIMTGAGITFYMLYLGNYALAAITVGVFAPLIGFHFAIDKVQRSNVDWRPTRTVKLHQSLNH